MTRQWPFLPVLALGAFLLAPTSARAQVVSADCYVYYRIADDSLTEMYVPLNPVSTRDVSASLDPPFTPAAMKRACLQLFYDNARQDCLSGPGADAGFLYAQVYLNTLDDVGARSKALINDIRVTRTAVKINWRKCSSLPSP